MASRSIVIKIKVEGASQAEAAFNKIAKAEELDRKRTKANNVEKRKQEKHLNAITNANKRAAASIKKTSQVQAGLTKSFIKGNLASRGITMATNAMKRVFLSSISTMVEFEFSMAKIAGIAGLTGVEFNKLEAGIRNIAKVTPRTASEVANAALQMSKLGLTGEDVEKSLKGVIDLSVALDENVSTVGETLVQVKNIFGLSASQMEEVGNKIFTAVSGSALSFEKLRVAMGFVGGTANAAGVSLSELSGMMGTLANSGLRASTIGTTLRTVITNLATPSSKASKELGGVSLQTHSLSQVLAVMNKEVTGVDKATALFGKRALSGALILAKNAGQVDNLTDSIREMARTTDEAADILDGTLKNALKRTSSQWEEFILNATNTKFIIGTVELLNKALNQLNEDEAKRLRQGAFFEKARNKGVGKEQRWKDWYASEELREDLIEQEKIFKGINKLENALDGLDNKKRQKFRMQGLLDKGLQRPEATNEEKTATEKQIKELKRIKDSIAFGKDQAVVVADIARATVALAKAQAETEDNEKANKVRQVQLKLTKDLLALDEKEAEVAKEKAEAIAIFNLETSLAFETMNIGATALNETFSVLGDNITDVFTTSGFSLTKLGDTFGNVMKKMAADLVATMIKLMIFRTILSLVGGTSTGGFGFKGGGSGLGSVFLGALGGTSAPGKASGMKGRVNKATPLIVGESGPEDILITPRAKTSSSGAGGNRIIQIMGDVYGEEQFTDRVRMANDKLDRDLV